MTSKRPRNFDYSKPLTRINRNEEFSEIQGFDIGEQFIVDKHSKENIIVPKVITLQNEKNNMYQNALSGELIEKKVKTQLGYIRVRKEEILPRPDRYELTDQDYNFWQEFVAKADNKGFSQEQFESLVKSIEMMSGKDTIVTWQEAQLEISKEVKNRLSEDS